MHTSIAAILSGCHGTLWRPVHTPLLCLIVISAVLAGCGDDKKPNTPGGPDWRLGQATDYTVDTPERVTVTDTATGLAFLFSEGGQGTLSVSPILSGPEAPYPGTGFSVSFDDEVPISVIVDPTGCDQIIVMGYGTAPGAYDDIPGPSERWVAMPIVDTVNDDCVVQLTLPFSSTGTSAQRKIAPVAGGGFSKYWISSIPAGSDEATCRVGLELQSQTVIDGILSLLSPARRSAARAEIDGRLLAHYAWDGFLYSGFWWRSLGSTGRIVRPTIHLRLNANAGNVAHETGHYLTHVLAGDDVYSTLEGQAPLWDNGHGIRDDVGRNMLLEDYAYYIEWLSVGTVKSYDLSDPYVIFGGMSPLTSDFPGIEGFAAVALAGLTRTDPTIRSLISGSPDNVPVIGLSHAQVFDIIAQGATGMEALRENMETAVGAEADKLPALLQRCGWRYSVRGRLLTDAGEPLAGATVASVSLVGDQVYSGGRSSVPSGSDGRFVITGEVFPGTSALRVRNGNDSIDVPITIDWTEPTNETVDLGDVRVLPQFDFARMNYGAVNLYTNQVISSNSGPTERYELVESDAVPGRFTGAQFTGRADDTDGFIHTITDLTATIDPQSGEVLTLELIKTIDVESGSYAWSESLHFTLHNVRMTDYYVSEPDYVALECKDVGDETCQHISTYTWGGMGHSGSSEFWSEMTDFNCEPVDGAVSSVRIIFYVGP